jgi:hypothetical protein
VQYRRFDYTLANTKHNEANTIYIGNGCYEMKLVLLISTIPIEDTIRFVFHIANNR